MVASVPYMDSEDRQELIENWQHIAGNETQANEEKYDRVSFADFQNEIKRGL